jgi:hypothetical protein
MTDADATLDLMTRCLADSGVDLADDVICMVHLMRNRFTAAEVRAHLDRARELARVRRGMTWDARRCRWIEPRP